MIRKIDISHKTIFFVTFFFGLLWVLFQIREVILVLFVAIIFMSALYPVIEYLQKYRIPKVLAIALTYLVIVGVIISMVALVVTPVIQQTSSLAGNLPQLIEETLPPQYFDRSIIQRELANVSTNALDYTLAFLNNFVSLISIAVLTFYLLLERERLDQLIMQFSVGHETRAKRITNKIEDKLGAWLRGQVALSVIIAVMVYIVLLVLGVPYALPLSILAGVLEVVPVIGPIISAIPAVLIAYLTDPVLALMVIGAFFVIQQLENHIIVPKVMQRAVGLNPLVVILAVAIGGKLLGVVGALLAVPITVVILIIMEDILKPEEILRD